MTGCGCMGLSNRKRERLKAWILPFVRTDLFNRVLADERSTFWHRQTQARPPGHRPGGVAHGRAGSGAIRVTPDATATTFS